MTDGNAENPSYYVFPSSYIVFENEDGKFEIYAGTESNPGLAQAMAEFNAAMGTSYYADYTITSSYAARRLNALVRFEFPSDVTHAHKDWCCMREYPKLAEVRINHPIDLSLGEKMFYNNPALTTVVGFENVTGLDNSIFMFCRKLQSVCLPTNVERIPENMFFGCGTNASVVFTIPNLAECTQLTAIGKDAFRDAGKIDITIPDTVTKIEARAFQAGCKNGNITINQTSQLQIIEDNAFTSCMALVEIFIPTSVTTIGASAFSGCMYLKELINFENCQITEIKANTFDGDSALKSIKIPETVTTIENAFISNRNLTKVYIPRSVTSIADTFVGSTWVEGPKNITFIYTGNNTEVLSACAMIAGANVIPTSEYLEDGTYTGANLVVGYSHCVAYYNGVHSDIEVDTVVNSYLEAIKVVNKCIACGSSECTEEISALFTCLGYSVSENGVGGVALGYRINCNSIAQYEEISNSTVEFGLFAASKTKLGDGDVFDADGVAKSGVTNVKMSSNSGAMELKIMGFTDANNNVKLAMGAYVITIGSESTEYSYLQVGTPNEGEKYCFASFAEISEALNQ